MFTTLLSRKNTVCAFALSILSVSGCGQPLVNGNAAFDGRSQGVLGSLTAMNGSYGASCIVGAGGNWIAHTSASMGDLSVVQNDQGCVLTIGSFDAGGITYSGSLAIPVDGSYGSAAAKFDDGAGNAIYAVASISAANYMSNFTINFLHSKNPDTTMQMASSQYQMRTGIFAATAVPAPSYALNIPAPPYLVDATAHITALSSTAPSLSQTAQAADDYQIVPGACPADPSVGYSGSVLGSLAWADFGLNVGDLVSSSNAVTDCVILRHCDASNMSVCSFQTFEVTFN